MITGMIIVLAVNVAIWLLEALRQRWRADELEKTLKQEQEQNHLDMRNVIDNANGCIAEFATEEGQQWWKQWKDRHLLGYTVPRNNEKEQNEIN